MSSDVSVRHRLRLTRLVADLAELEASPYPGVAIFIDDADITNFCLHLSPASGPFTGLRLHFDVEIPENWPTSPPRIRSSVHGIEHPNLFGEYICCDLLKEDRMLQAGYTGGYTPALTLRGLFMQFLSFFASSKVEQDYGNASYDIGEAHTNEYFSERELMERVLSSGRHWKWDEAIGYDRDYFSSSTVEKRQLSNQRLWMADNSAEAVVLNLNLPTTNAVITTKAGPAKGTFRLTYPNPRFYRTYERIKRWSCTKRCGYGSTLSHLTDQQASSFTTITPNHPALHPPRRCLLPLLDTDTAHYLCTHLPTESLMSLSSAYPPFHKLITTSHLLLQRELRCFFLKTPVNNTVLGIGVALDSNGRSLSSEFDWISQEAFETHQIRKSIRKTPFQFFLPLAFSKSHYFAAQKSIWLWLQRIDAALFGNSMPVPSPGLPQPPGPWRTNFDAIRVIYRLMNNIVVSLMKSCDAHFSASRLSNGNDKPSTLLHASEKAVTSYCQLYHLLICLSKSYPAIITKSLQRIQKFIASPTNRTKKVIPDLGELLVQASLVFGSSSSSTGKPPLGWATDLNRPFLHETFVRNVRWVLQAAPELEFLEAPTSPSGADYRLKYTFEHSKTSLRLVMFQATFVRIFVQAHLKNPPRLLETYGFPIPTDPKDPSFPEQMVAEIKSIYAVNTWPMFFDKVDFPKAKTWGKEGFATQLRGFVQESETRGYHKPSHGKKLGLLKSMREMREREERDRTLKQLKPQ